MFERYTERARRVLFFARYEAFQFGSLTIETEHILLGLLREGKGPVARLFARSHVSLDEIRDEVAANLIAGEDKIDASVEIPFSAEAKRVLLFGLEESDALHHHQIGVGHLLLGILRAEGSKAASILYAHGMRSETIREDIVQLRKERAGGENG